MPYMVFNVTELGEKSHFIEFSGGAPTPFAIPLQCGRHAPMNGWDAPHWRMEKRGVTPLSFWVLCRCTRLSRPSWLIIRNPPHEGVLSMQGIVQALITRPQLAPLLFRQRHIQAVIRPLLVLVSYGEGAVGQGGHIAEHKR